MNTHPLTTKAHLLAIGCHINQPSDDGRTQYEHVSKVAQILSLITDDPEIIAAGFLHDTIEDAGLTREYIEIHFSKRVADLVYEVTHVGDKSTGYTFPNLVSREAALIKFADRLHNLSRMGCWDEARQNHYLQKSSFWKGGEKINENNR